MVEAQSKQGPRILVVDDEEDILESLKELLEISIEGAEVLAAASAEDAMKLLDTSLDLVVSDYRMPGMNGLEFLETVRRKAPQVPRIMATAFPDLQLAIQAINDAKVDRFFTKPLDPTEVVDIVQAILKERRDKILRDRAFARAMGHRRGEGKGGEG